MWPAAPDRCAVLLLDGEKKLPTAFAVFVAQVPTVLAVLETQLLTVFAALFTPLTIYLSLMLKALKPFL